MKRLLAGASLATFAASLFLAGAAPALAHDPEKGEAMPFPYFGGNSQFPLLSCVGDYSTVAEPENCNGADIGGRCAACSLNDVCPLGEDGKPKPNGTCRPECKPKTIASAQNPVGLKACTSLCDLVHTLQHIIYFGLTILCFVIVPVMAGYGGILILTGGGSPSQITQGTKAIYAAGGGLLLGVGAFLIVSTFLWLLFGGVDELTYEGDALLTEGQRVSWPNIACANPVGFKAETLKFEASSNDSEQACRAFCTNPGQGTRYSGFEKFDAKNPVRGLRCVCKQRPSACASAGNTCRTSCGEGEEKVGLECSQSQDSCCKKAATTGQPPPSVTPPPPAGPGACGQAQGQCMATCGGNMDQINQSGCQSGQQCCVSKQVAACRQSGGKCSGQCIGSCPSGQTCSSISNPQGTGSTACITQSDPTQLCQGKRGQCWYQKKRPIANLPQRCNSGSDRITCAEFDRNDSYAPIASCYERITCP